MKINLSTVISLICCVVAVFTYFKNRDKDTKQSGSLEAEVKYISRGVDEIRLDNKEVGNKLIGIDKRLTIVEESSKSAHHRIDEIVSKKKENDEK